MLLSYNELVDLVDKGYLTNVKPEAINAASIDLHLGDTFLKEREWEQDDHGDFTPIVDLGERQSVSWISSAKDYPLFSRIEHKGMILEPNEFILAHTVEKFHLPDDISAEYSLKSSLARNGLEHLMAGWIDPGFTNSVLTLELKNSTRYHRLKLTPGMPIGQVKFFRHEPVPADKSYRARGRYNGDDSVQKIKP